MPVAQRDLWAATSTVDDSLAYLDASGTSWRRKSMRGIVRWVCAIPFSTGSGGLDTVDIQGLDTSSAGYSVRVRPNHGQMELCVPRPRRTSDSLAMIRAVLGTNVTQTAGILQVKRQTIYAWLANRTSPQRAKRARLDQILNLARQWRRVSKTSLRGHLHETVHEGESLLQLLSEEHLPMAEIAQYFMTLATENPARKSAREWAIEMGIEMPSEEEQQRAVDRATGKRSSPE